MLRDNLVGLGGEGKRVRGLGCFDGTPKRPDSKLSGPTVNAVFATGGPLSKVDQQRATLPRAYENDTKFRACDCDFVGGCVRDVVTTDRGQTVVESCGRMEAHNG